MINGKNCVCLVLCLALLSGALTGCGAHGGAKANAGTCRVVTTVFPAYDWTRQILGGNPGGVELTYLLDRGADMHSYQPTAEDMIRVSACDLFVHVGGESDAWVKDALAGAVNRDMLVIDLLDVLGGAAKEEETVEGMERERGGHGEDGPEYDEHVWLSVKNAALFCGAISDALGKIDAANRNVYAANADAYREKLNALDARYSAAVSAAEVRTVLFGDRFPFRYLADDYGLAYYAAFAGCSAETEASFETVAFLADKVDELGLNAVLTIESGDGRVARTIVENTDAGNARILRMDSMQSVTAQRIADGATYLGVMEENLEVLKEALRSGKGGRLP